LSESHPALESKAGFAGLIGLLGVAAACLAGCYPTSGGDDASGLSGCWAVQDTTYVEAGFTRYETGTLTLSQHEMDIKGEIVWDDSTYPVDSISGRRNGDSLNLTLTHQGISEGRTLRGTMRDSSHFYVTSGLWIGSGTSFSASRLAKCPVPRVANPNPRKLQLHATQDSIGVSHVDSTSLFAFASFAYFGDSDVVRFSKAYDTLTFTYRSYQDRYRGAKSITGAGFSLLTTPQGEKVIYGSVYPYYDDVLSITDSTDYSLNESIVIPGGLPKGKYKLVIRLQVECYCIPGPSDFYVKEFTLE
jgi:hypothetical protein